MAAPGLGVTTLLAPVTPRRRILLVIAAVATVASCGGSTRPAATVDGTEISQQDVVDELDAIRANTAYLETVESGGTVVLGESEGSFDSAFVATQLAIRIQYAIVTNEVDRRGLEPEGACRSAARDLVVRQIGEDNLTGFPEPYQDYLVDREADILLLQGDLVGQPCVADAAVEAYYDEHREEFTQACGAHILVDSQEEADELVTLLRAGADFAALAAERSTDVQSAAAGGELPCVSQGEFIPELDAALFSQSVGEVGEPVQTSFGFHVLRVLSRDVAPLADVRGQVEQAIAGDVQVAFRGWFEDALAAADVTVDPRYGRWDPSVAGVVRPGADATTP